MQSRRPFTIPDTRIAQLLIGLVCTAASAAIWIGPGLLAQEHDDGISGQHVDRRKNDDAGKGKRQDGGGRAASQITEQRTGVLRVRGTGCTACPSLCNAIVATSPAERYQHCFR